MSVNIPRTFVFSDGFSIDPIMIESEISNVIQTVNNANAGLITWDNVKATTVTATTLNSSALTASTVVVTDSSKNLASSAVTTTTLAFLDATSNVQTQLNTKLASPLAADLNANSHKITSLTAGTASGDAANFGQIFTGFQAPVIATTTTTTTTTSSTFTNTSLAASISPTVSTHRIKISVSGGVQSASTTTACEITVKRGTTNLAGTDGFAILLPNTSATLRAPASFVFIDSPATTSATTYTVAVRSTDNVNTVKFLPSGETGVIILEEIV